MTTIKSIVMCLSLFSFLMIGTVETAQAQTEQLSKKERRKARSKYIGLSAGLGKTKFRDFAISPLYYQGTTRNISLSYQSLGADREAELAFAYITGKDLEGSVLKRFELSYQRLYQLSLIADERYNTKIGFNTEANANLRINQSFINTAGGAEVFAHASLVMKIAREFGRDEQKQRNFGVGVLVGLVNANFKRGEYQTDTGLLHQKEIKAILGSQEISLFSGYKFGTRLDYTHGFRNQNALQFSYIWDAYSSGGKDIPKFQMASHTLSLTFLFHTNNK